MYSLKSLFWVIAFSFSSTIFFVIIIFALGPIFSGISNNISFKSLLITVWSLLAPIFSSSELIINAFSEISFRASSLNIISTFSDLIKAVYCFVNEFLGSFNIFKKSSCVRLSNSTLIGNLPWSSGIKSDGFDKWKAPAAINKTWSWNIVTYYK